MVKLLALAAVASTATAFEIVNGTEVPIGKYPYVTGLRRNETARSSCGASLVAPKILVSAAYCIASPWATFAAVGTHFLSGNLTGERIRIVKRTPHPKYNSSNLDYDFAVLELETAASFPPVKLNWEDDQFNAPGVTSWVRGWGTTRSGGSQSPVLLEAPVAIWSNTECQKALAGQGTITPSMLCAGGADKDTCQGDSGGPLTVLKNGEEYLTGVTSWGIGCARPGLPGVYGRISLARDFIEPFLPKPVTTVKPGC